MKRVYRYSMPDLQRAFGISPNELKWLYRSRILPEFDSAGARPETCYVREDVGKGGGRLWTAYGVLRLFVTHYLVEIGLWKRPIIQACSMLFQGITSDDGPRPWKYKEYERILRRRFIEAEGERKYILIGLGSVMEVGENAARGVFLSGKITGAEVVSTLEHENPPGEPGFLIIPIRQVMARIRERLAAIGLNPAEFKLTEKD